MTAAQEVQDLLRFLTKEAKVPLATAMSKINELRKNHLSSSDLIANTSLPNVQKHFEDEKLAKSVFNAAKRVNKKRASGDTSTSASKRSRKSSDPDLDDAKALEHSLELPTSDVSEEELLRTVLQTNRAPLVLAFCVVLLQYTMPEQPLSSRLSLSQAVVSLGARSKAYAIGLDKSKTAEDEGWGQGQPKVKIMGRDIPIMRRAGYHQAIESKPEQVDDATTERPSKKVKTETREDVDHIETESDPARSGVEALWGLDLEALRKFNGPLIPGASTGRSNSMNGLPIFSPHAARSYILKSFVIVDKEQEDPKSDHINPETSSSPTKKKAKTPAQLTAEKSHALALLLQAINLLFKSWATSLTKEELDRRAWSWYVNVRPDVEPGQSGWGQRGELKLQQILALRKGH